MGMTVLPWDEMTPEQREFVVYLYASLYMSEVLKWDPMPNDYFKEKLDSLDHAWDESREATAVNQPQRS